MSLASPIASPIASPEADRIGALLTGRAAPRERIARALATYLAPLRAAPLGELLGEVRIAPVAEADEVRPGRWARLGGATLHVPGKVASAMGTVMLGGTPDTGAGSDDSNDDGGATPVDWHLVALVLDAIGGALSPPLAFEGWCEGEPEASGDAAGTLRVELGGTIHSLVIRVPIAALPLRAPSAVDAPAPAPRPSGERDPRRSASIAASATLDMPTRSLRAALAIRTGDVLPLDGSLGAIAVRADGRTVLTGALGHAGGHLCLRVIERAAEPDFAALAGASVPAASAREPDTHDTPTDHTTASPERRSAM